MKIRVLNEDGIQYNTKVFNAETGEELRGVSEIDVHYMKVRLEPVAISLELESSLLDIIGYAKFYTHCPHCGEKIQGVGVKE